jgi:hypothetical protein
MLRRFGVGSLSWLAVLAMVSCKGCGEGSSSQATAPDSGGDELQVLDTRVFLAAGETDFKNRYPSTIMVTTGNPWESELCSGVLIAPRLALTAAHCVCERRRAPALEGADGFVIDGSACVKLAVVTTVTYDPAEARIGTGGKTQVHQGVVLPHPEFKLLLDPQEQVLSSKADLALIRLDEPLDAGASVSPLADAAVQQGESLLMAGYGHHSPAGRLYGLRYVRRNKVTRAETPSDERVLYEQQGAYLYKGFDGGPCFREEGQQSRLVGIAGWGTDKELAFTETYTYRDWLHAAIQDTNSAKRP